MARGYRIAGRDLSRFAIVARLAMVALVAHLGNSSGARLRVRHLVRVYLEPIALEPHLLSHGRFGKAATVLGCKVRFRQNTLVEESILRKTRVRTIVRGAKLRQLLDKIERRYQP